MIILINHGWMIVCLVPPPFALKSLSNFFFAVSSLRSWRNCLRARVREFCREKISKRLLPIRSCSAKTFLTLTIPLATQASSEWNTQLGVKRSFSFPTIFLRYPISMLKLDMLMQKTTTTARNGGKECHNLKAYESKKICRQMTQLCQ